MNLHKKPADPLKNPSVPILTALSLRKAKHTPPCPFKIELSDGRQVTVTRLLRVLPGKRVTGMGTLENTPVLIKLFISSSSSRHWRREMSGITTLQEAELPTPRVVDSSPLRPQGHALLIEFLDPSETLADEEVAATENNSCTEKESVLSSVLLLLGKLHAAGLLHTDLHLGNFLRYHGDVFIIDCGSIRAVHPGTPLCNRKALYNLITLLALLPEKQDHLLPIYLSENPTLRVNPNLIRIKIDKKRNDYITRHLKKSFRSCSDFAVQKSFNRFSSVIRQRSEEIAWILNDPDQAIETSSRLKDGTRTTISLTESPQGSFVIKRYNLPSGLYAFSRLWRPSRAWNAWKEGLRLQCLGIQTPKPLALIENRIGPLRSKAWVINEFCPGTPLLEKLNPDCVPPKEQADGILSFFNALFRERITHGDFKASNLLWHNHQISVLDLDAMRKHRFEFTRRRAWKKDRARLLRNWPPETPLHQWLDANIPK